MQFQIHRPAAVAVVLLSVACLLPRGASDDKTPDRSPHVSAR
jgi:hypothetical protein